MSSENNSNIIICYIDEENQDDEDDESNRRRRRRKKDIKIYPVINYEPFGYKTELTKDTPFINNLICKRTGYYNGASNHIAVFVSSVANGGIDISSLGYGRVVIGENSTRALYSNKKITTHAEMDALIKVDSLIKCKKLKKNTRLNLIVIRINRSGLLRESAPCFHCSKELAKRNNIIIDKLYFSRTNESITCIKFDEYINYFTPYVSRGWKCIQNKL
jgi:hypothetical protein